MSSNIRVPVMPEPEVIDRHLPTGITLRGYTRKQLEARDAQWQEMYGPVVEAAFALRLALNWKCAVMCNPSNPVGMVADADTQMWARLDDLSAALSAITKD